MSWYKEFEEEGGYDCMYDAFHIKDEGTGNTICEIDFRHHGQDPCKPYGPKVMESAEAAADKIVAAWEMLAALDSFTRGVDAAEERGKTALDLNRLSCHRHRMKAAIAKAKGQA